MVPKQRHWNFLILMVLTLEGMADCWERPPPSRPYGKRSKDAQRFSKIGAEKTRARILRRLLDTSYKRLGYKEPSRWSDPWADWEDDDEEHFFGYGSTKWEGQLPSHRDPYIPPLLYGQKESKRFKDVDQMLDTNFSNSCCPQQFELTEPASGRNTAGNIVDLYKNEGIQQRFYELVCDPEFANKPCRFLQGRNYKMSKCTQQHIFTYALVNSNSGNSTNLDGGGWSLDHILIRSGCVCKLDQSGFLRRKKAQGNKKKG